jgi:hypothetical protein
MRRRVARHTFEPSGARWIGIAIAALLMAGVALLRSPIPPTLPPATPSATRGTDGPT